MPHVDSMCNAELGRRVSEGVAQDPCPEDGVYGLVYLAMFEMVVYGA